MDLYYNQLKIIFLFILLFFGCESIIENNINETTSELEVISFYVNYDDQENEISVYLEVSESNEISSVLAEISNPDNDEIITEFDLVNLGDLNPNVFTSNSSRIPNFSFTVFLAILISSTISFAFAFP